MRPFFQIDRNRDFILRGHLANRIIHHQMYRSSFLTQAAPESQEHRPFFSADNGPPQAERYTFKIDQKVAGVGR
jgi:hypothetical protein